MRRAVIERFVRLVGAVGLVCAALLVLPALGAPAPASASVATPANPLVWSAATSVDPSQSVVNGLSLVSCVSTTFCMAVGSDASTWNGSSWSSPSTLDSEGVPNAVSCPSTTFCAVVDQHGNALTWNGISWSSQSTIDPGGALLSVSCHLSTFCMAVDGAGNAFTWNGSSWSSPSSFDASGGPLSVSCPSTTFCAVVDQQGDALDVERHSVDDRVSDTADSDRGSRLVHLLDVLHGNRLRGQLLHLERRRLVGRIKRPGWYRSDIVRLVDVLHGGR